MPVVPMFHANAWGLPYAALMQGAGLVLPGPHLDPESLVDLMQARVRHDHRGRPDDLDGSAPASGREPWRARPVRAPLDGRRRFRDPSGDDRSVRQTPPAARGPRLGHDRDDSARHRLAHAARSHGGARRGEVPAAGKTGPPVALRRDPGAQRDRADRLGRYDHGGARGPRTMGRGRVLQPRRLRRSLHGRRLVQDRRHRHDRRARDGEHPGSIEGSRSSPAASGSAPLRWSRR